MQTIQSTIQANARTIPPGRSTVRSCGIALSLLAALLAQPVMAADADLEKRLEALQREIEALKAQMQKTQTEQAKMKASAGTPQAAAGGPQVTFGGQYRINSYSVDNGGGAPQQVASRARIRQNIDIKFDEQFKTHLQMEVGHTTDNVTTTQTSTRGNVFAIRHAVMDYTATNGINAQMGIVPLSDHFGDTLFSSSWNYNPLALSLTTARRDYDVVHRQPPGGREIGLGAGHLRAFAGVLKKGSETNTNTNDLSHYQLDYVLPLAGNNRLNFGASFIRAADPLAVVRNHSNFGLWGNFEVGGGLMLNAFLLGSRTDKELLGTAGSGSGTAIKLELTGGAGAGNFGLMATYASGLSDGSGFLPVQALARTNGYWGYTGILTVQGPTDTGFDGDSVNISNNGYGLSTLQAKYSFPISGNLSGYVGVGWFGSTKTPVGRSGGVGTDLILMGTYRFTKVLALNFGVDSARLKDGVSGYSNGVIGGAAFNHAAGVSRTKNALFTRLQAEF